jgi:NAD(P)-dependent dehydrogenase (short-subunit alcohol dehydrogenase family)
MRITDIINEMRLVAPPGQFDLDDETRTELIRLTHELMAADTAAVAEYRRFLGVRDRELDLSGIQDELRETYGGKRILVTGGTGCIGRALIAQLKLCGPAEIFAISRGRRPYEPIPGVTYVQVDVSQLDDLLLAVASTRPDVVFHLAAQRSPWLAERAVEETVMTNVIGTRNLLRACRAAEVKRFVHSSTGKAMRYYTSDIYAASKKLAEWLVHVYAAEGAMAGAARFTHVVDNGVILQKIQEAIDDAGGPTGSVLRIHEPDINFYIQSAVESAQLLLLAGIGTELGRLRMVAIRCLGDPAPLLSVTCGKLSQDAAGLDCPPIYLSGYDKGYERGNPPGLYDPMNAADFSPLINAIEAAGADEDPGVSSVDRFHLSLPTDGTTVDRLADELADACAVGNAPAVAELLAEAGKVLAGAMFDECPAGLFARLERMATQAGVPLPCERSVAEAPVE